MSRPRAQLHYLEGFITPKEFIKFAEAQSLEPKEGLLLIFPSNTGHHTSTTTLYKIKSGGGLGQLAGHLGQLGIPVLGLPTTGMKRPPDENTLEFAKNAVADLWKAAGYGLHLLLPIRPKFTHPKSGATYFQETLKDKPGFEPSFWGDWEPIPNPALAAYYFAQLEVLKAFLAADADKQPPVDAFFLNAFQEGAAARLAPTPPPWFQKPVGLKAQQENSVRQSAAPQERLAAQDNPSYQPIYAAQEKARWWKTALAITVGILTLPTLILPALSYFLWRRAKANELVQKVEMSPNDYAELKETRRALKATKLENEKRLKPQKEVIITIDQNPDEKAVYYMDREQAKRLQFFAERKRLGDGSALSEEERELLRHSKNESVRLAPSLGYK